MKRKTLTIFTIGHSTRSLDEVVDILRAHHIERLVDVRTIPRSRTNPQFNKDTFSKHLRNRHISYRHMKELGGLRHARKDSMNNAWRNSSFRGYADYMQTDEFQRAIDKLVELASARTTAIMCAESLPWRCHRSLIGDALLARGINVLDIYSRRKGSPHKLSDMARVKGRRVFYPGRGNNTDPDMSSQNGAGHGTSSDNNGTGEETT